MTIAFTGATGQFGAHVAEALLARTDASNLVALARDPQKAADLAEKGIEVRAFDYDQPDTLADALPLSPSCRRGRPRRLLPRGTT